VKGNFFQGVYYFWQGALLIFHPGIRRYIFFPILINFILFAAIFVGMAWYLFGHFTDWTTDFPKWVLLLLGWLFWILYSAFVLIVGSFTFTLFTNLIASPFYGYLAEAVEKEKQPSGIITTPFSITHILWREVIKISYFLPWLLLFAVLFLIPPLWPFMPFIIFFPTATFIAMQYIDYCPDNQGIPFKTVRAKLNEAWLTMIGFGSMVSLAMTIPGANLFVPPAAVAGGCILWLNLQAGKDKRG